MTWSNVGKEIAKGGLVLLALAVVFAACTGVITILHQRTCDRLDAVRASYLEPGHATQGPGSIYVIGVGPGPPPSKILPYLEAKEAMTRAGCAVPGE